MPSGSRALPSFASGVEVFEESDGTLIVAMAREGFVQISPAKSARAFIGMCAGGSLELEAVKRLWARGEVRNLSRTLEHAGMLAWPGTSAAVDAQGYGSARYDPGTVLLPALPKMIGRLPRSATEERSATVVSGESWAELAVAGSTWMGETEPWLFVHAGGSGRFITPVIGGGDGACWRCLLFRLAGLDDVLSYLLPRIVEGSCRRLSTYDEHHAPPPPLGGVKRALAAAGETDRDVLLFLDETRVGTHHYFTDVAGCEHSLRGRRGTRSLDSGAQEDERRPHRPDAEPWEQLRARAGHLVDAVTGLVCPPMILAESPVFTAMTKYADTGGAGSVIVVDERGRIGFEPSLRRETFGSGITCLEAETVAILEGLERYCSLVQEHDCVIPGVAGDLSLAHLCSESGWLCIRQADESCSCTATNWAETRSLDGEVVLVPAYRCYRGAGEARFLRSHRAFTSTGMAIDQCREDAIIAGFLEVIEREAVTRWWYQRAACPSLHLGGLADPLILSVVSHHETAGRSLAVFAVPSTIQDVHVFVAVSSIEELGFPLLGMGASLQPLTGVRRALKELSQAMACEEVERRKWQGFSPTGQRHLRPAGTRMWPWPTSSLAERERGSYAARKVRKAASNAGRRICVLDYDRPEVPFACVRVFLPLALASEKKVAVPWARQAAAGEIQQRSVTAPCDIPLEHIRW